MESDRSTRRSFSLRLLNIIVLPLLKTWVAGEYAANAIHEAEKFQGQAPHLSTLINYLGEHYHQSSSADRAYNEYVKVVKLIKARGIRADISFKPSQLGFDVPKIGEKLAAQYVFDLVKTANEHGVKCWFEMESTRYTEFTLQVYKDLLKQYDNVAVIMQANLKRTFDDVVMLTSLDRSTYPNPPKFRLCKGIYIEPEDISYRAKTDVNANYKKIIEYAFLNAPNDIGIGIATHDEQFVDLAMKLRAMRPPKHMEFQMLRGIRPELQREVIRLGVPFSLYIPYGEESVPYSYRRAMKANNMRGTLVRSVLSAIMKRGA